MKRFVFDWIVFPVNKYTGKMVMKWGYRAKIALITTPRIALSSFFKTFIKIFEIMENASSGWIFRKDRKFWWEVEGFILMG